MALLPGLRIILLIGIRLPAESVVTMVAWDVSVVISTLFWCLVILDISVTYVRVPPRPVPPIDTNKVRTRTTTNRTNTRFCKYFPLTFFRSHIK